MKKEHPKSTAVSELAEEKASLATLRDQLDQLTPVDLSCLPQLEQLFNADIPLHSVKGPHTGLLTSDNLANVSNQRIVGVWLQGIDPNVGNEGRIMPHDHGADNVTEIIITYDDSAYAGLPEPIESVDNRFFIHLVPPGKVHGSQTQPSYGSWISIKYLK
jgi:hypothetical protein